MSAIASKNLYELLGNDPELDPERKQPEPPTRAIEKPLPRTGKRNGPSEAPSSDSSKPRSGGRRENFSGNEQAFRDRNAGSGNNRSKPADDGFRQDRHPDRLRGPNEHRDINGRPRTSRGGNRGLGYRGTRTGRDDRHSRTGVADHEKQVAHGWGGQTGGEELADEQAGEALAKDEAKEGFDTAPEAVNADGEPVDIESKTKSYDAYLAELAEKKLQLGGKPEVRKPNEGTAQKFPEGKAITRDNEEEAYIPGAGGKAQRQRERKQKALVELDDEKLHREPERPSFRGGRGGRGRGEGSFRGEGRGRGGRGGRGGERGGAERGGPRGPRGSAPVNPDDTKAFPALGK